MKRGEDVAIDVFLSVGQTVTKEQEAFVSAIERCLLEHDLRPRTLGRNEWSSRQPLQAIKERMDECAGSVIVAFERLHIADGTEKRGSDAARPMRDEVRTTIWNQMEAAMAYALGHPILVLAQEGIWVEGVLEPRDWAVQWLGLDPGELETAECVGVIDDWKKHVVAFSEHRAKEATVGEEDGKDVGDKTIGEILGQLRPGQFRALVVGVVSTLAAIAGTAFSLGVKFG
jgi:hypothetical protein